MFKVSENLLYVREKSGNFFHSDVWQPWQKFRAYIWAFTFRVVSTKLLDKTNKSGFIHTARIFIADCYRGKGKPQILLLP